jgi:hypothetical protein
VRHFFVSGERLQLFPKFINFETMKIALQYVSDMNGKPQAVQMPVSEWEKVLSHIRKSEQVLKLKSDLKVAFKQVDTLRKSKAKKQTLTDFLNEL